MYNKNIVVELFFVASLITSALAATTAARSVNSNKVASASSENSWFGGEFSVLQKVYDDCQDKNDFTGCLKGKAMQAVSRAIDMDAIQLIDGVSLVKQNNSDSVDVIPGLSDPRTLNSLSGTDRSLVQKVDKFLKSHVLRVDMNEGRGKDKKSNSRYVIAALLTAMGIAGPIGLKALAAIAGKALVISKVALTIAGIIALKKIFSHDHHEETSFQVHAGGHDNRRNTYVVRPVKPAPGVIDPYRYYYDQQYPAHA